jgi:hypothetical protein
MRIQMKQAIFAGILLFTAVATATGSDFRVKLKFDYQDTKLRVQLYDVKSEYTFSVSKTALAKSLNETPAAGPLKDELSFTPDDDAKTFLMVVSNTSKIARYFFASPHTLHPGHASLGLLFECLCNHHVYKVPAGMIWYRIVRLKADFKKIPAGKKGTIQLTHAFVEVPEEKAQKEYRTMLYDPSDAQPETKDQGL